MNVEFAPADTTPEAAWVQMQIYRRMSPSRRSELAFEMSHALRDIVVAGVRSRHPDYDEEKVKLAVIRLTIGDELFRQAFPGAKVQV